MCGKSAGGHLAIAALLPGPLGPEPTSPDSEALLADGDKEQPRCRVLTGGGSLCTAECSSLLSEKREEKEWEREKHVKYMSRLSHRPPEACTPSQIAPQH